MYPRNVLLQPELNQRVEVAPGAQTYCKWITLSGRPCRNFALYADETGQPVCCGIRKHRFYCKQKDAFAPEYSQNSNLQKITTDLIEMETKLTEIRKTLAKLTKETRKLEQKSS
jgi:hypothetical protein